MSTIVTHLARATLLLRCHELMEAELLESGEKPCQQLETLREMVTEEVDQAMKIAAMVPFAAQVSQ